MATFRSTTTRPSSCCTQVLITLKLSGSRPMGRPCRPQTASQGIGSMTCSLVSSSLVPTISGADLAFAGRSGGTDGSCWGGTGRRAGAAADQRGVGAQCGVSAQRGDGAQRGVRPQRGVGPQSGVLSKQAGSTSSLTPLLCSPPLAASSSSCKKDAFASEKRAVHVRAPRWCASHSARSSCSSQPKFRKVFLQETVSVSPSEAAVLGSSEPPGDGRGSAAAGSRSPSEKGEREQRDAMGSSTISGGGRPAPAPIYLQAKRLALS
mmetsp:Transcript_12046/g.35221  ORF Transcript_12046/g.35221 Transcript_12046/m.35221 type:complete len:264 (-) Transcript_12046:2-793(-)